MGAKDKSNHLTAGSLQSFNNWSLTASSGKAIGCRNREQVVLDMFSNFKWVRSMGFFGELVGPKTQHASVCRLKTLPCVHSKRPRVCRQHAHMSCHTTTNNTPHTTHLHTPTHTTQQPHTPTHTTSHTTSHEDRERREDEREDEKQDEREETEIMMWADVESKFAQEKAKLAKLKSAKN